MFQIAETLIPFSFSELKLKASQLLRTTKEKQCRSVFKNEEGAYCVQGLLLKHLGCPEDKLINNNPWQDESYKKMMDMLGNDEKVRDDIVWMNNYGESFDAIASFLESKNL